MADRKLVTKFANKLTNDFVECLVNDNISFDRDHPDVLGDLLDKLIANSGGN